MLFKLLIVLVFSAAISKLPCTVVLATFREKIPFFCRILGKQVP